MIIDVRDVVMNYPIPKSYKDWLIRPFAPRKKVTALHPCSLTIERGDKIAFLGANGAGKTTLLKLIGGLLYPTSGEILVNHYQTQKQNMQARQTIGFVLNEERSFYWRLTGRQNLEFFGKLDNLKGEALHQKIDELLDLVQLTAHAEKDFAGYSSGMKQRLAIARGLLADPEVLILDEPTRTLDPIGKEEVIALIKMKIHQQLDRTLLIATHDLEEAQAMCNKIIIMKAGKILHYGTTDAILAQYGSLQDYYFEMIMGQPTPRYHELLA
ncbi:MAG: ABC transporter ATP-binding protein [Cytophagales bacterium]|nr:ABC transporter ATP-binding protein [Cytophagales bacterium]